MDVPFVSAQAVSEDFYDTVMRSVFVISVMMIAAFIRSRGKPTLSSARTIGVLGVAAFGCVVLIAYLTSYGRFIRAQVDGAGVVLAYADPFGKKITIPRDGIESVLFGLPAKSNRQCYIQIRQRSGESHRSATIVMDKNGACKALREEIVGQLAL